MTKRFSVDTPGIGIGKTMRMQIKTHIECPYCGKRLKKLKSLAIRKHNYKNSGLLCTASWDSIYNTKKEVKKLLGQNVDVTQYFDPRGM